VTALSVAFVDDSVGTAATGSFEHHDPIATRQERPVNLEMDHQEIDRLLAEPRIGVLSIAGSAGAAPLMTPLWFAHVDGAVAATTARSSVKVRWLRRTRRATFFVQSEAPPRYVAIDVDVDIDEPDEALRRQIAARYVPPDMLDGYLVQTASADVVALRMRPVRFRSADLTKAMAPA
jgi:hypothetical protein